MESILSSSEDFLLPGLSYDLAGDQASYVVARRQSQISSNVPVAGPQAVRQVSFNIADPSGFLDLSSLCFSWTVVNNDGTKAMQPLSAVPHCCWSRMIVTISSAVAEDIQHSSRLEEMLNRFFASGKASSGKRHGIWLGIWYRERQRPFGSNSCCEWWRAESCLATNQFRDFELWKALSWSLTWRLWVKDHS